MSPIRASSVVGLVLSSLTLQGCGSSSEILAQTKQCTVDADCSGNGWCLDGVCQTPYGLALTIDKAPAADGKIHVSSTLNLSATVTGGTPPVEFALVDEGRLQLVASPYSWQWDVKTAKVTEGSHRVIATAKGGTRTYSSQSIEVIVDRVAPSPPVVDPVASPSKGTALVLAGTAEEKTTLTVYEGTTPIAQVQVPAGGVWNTQPLTLAEERNYALTATVTDLAGNVSDPSPPAVVTVDRTPPQVARVPSGVLDVVPAPGSQNVWSRERITVTFTEPVDPLSLTSATVRLAGDASGPIATKIFPLEGGRTFEVRPDTLPPVPDRLTLTLTAGIRDFAGNALVVPTAPADAWWWAIPQWQELGTGVTFGTIGDPKYSLAADASARPILAAVDVRGNMKGPWRWTGSGLVNLGNPGGYLGYTYAASVGFLGDGTPLAAWRAIGATEGVNVSIHSDSGWPARTLLSHDLNLTQSNPALRVDPRGRAVIAWAESTSGFVVRWNGTGWDTIGGALTLPAAPTIDFDTSGEPLVSSFLTPNWSTMSWVGGAWTKVASCRRPSGTTDSASAVYRVGPSKVMYLALNTATVPQDLLVYQCTENGLYAPVLGSAPLNTSGAGVLKYAMELSSVGLPVAAWIEGSNGIGARVFVKRWTGERWESLGGDLASGIGVVYGVALAVGPGGETIVAIDEGSNPDASTTHLKRYNR